MTTERTVPVWSRVGLAGAVTAVAIGVGGMFGGRATLASAPARAMSVLAAQPGDVPAAIARDVARDEDGAENNPAADEFTQALYDSVERGFEYLKGQQNADGSFGRGRYGRHVGITALCALAFMADGNLPGRGPYGEQVQKALDFVITHGTETGLLAAETSHGPMYGHGFATLFLGEIYGMSPGDRRVRDALVKAVDLILGTQNQEGGWRYNPVPYDADISVTICEIMAMRSARNAGIKVPKETIDRAVKYVRDCQNADGGFRYMTHTGGSAWPRTAAGVASLFYAGIYEDDSIDRGLDYLMRTAMPGPDGRLSGQPHYYYGHYYAVQAMYLAGGERWQRWWPAVRDELISKQSSNGGWLDHHAGGAYATAMALIVLQMPKRYLPIFQKQ
ncbi:MAG: terpene cyclase/mutase family protein [Phycisphaerales bacterium]|nr:terpene cyclase/mutase family protein [Phycisphaerales bacterium]